jgi:predicted kinase
MRKGCAMSIDWKAFGIDGAVDWHAIETEFPYAGDMAACIQDKIYHAEGDVLIHTRMVMDHLFADPEFQALPPDRRNVMALSVLWHDVSKPETRTELFDEQLGRVRVSHPHHASKGAYRAWRDLWRAGVPVHARFDVFAHVLGHQQIFRVLKTHGDHRPALARLSILSSLYELTMLAKADNRGRICAEPRIAEDEMELIRLAAAECECLDRAWPFASSHARLRFARGVADSLFFEPQPPKGSCVIVLSGLPGSGKDTYVRTILRDYGHVSLDVTREAMNVGPTDNQGRVAQATVEACRVHLRAKAPFVFNATNLTRLQRAKIITLAIAYDAHVTVHAFDVSEASIRKQNREREASVPETVLDSMIEKWEPPTLLEAHDVVWIGSDFRPVLKPGTVAGEAAPIP